MIIHSAMKPVKEGHEDWCLSKRWLYQGEIVPNLPKRAYCLECGGVKVFRKPRVRNVNRNHSNGSTKEQ